MKEFLTRKEVAALLRVSVQTISIWVHSGKLKAQKVGKKLLISKASVYEALEEAGNGQ